MIINKKTIVCLKYLLLFFFVSMLLPFVFFKMPRSGLDGSWNIAINLAHKYDLVFGKEFVFNYGPLGILHSRLPIAVNIFVYIFFDLYCLITVLSILNRILKIHFDPGTLLFVFLILILAMHNLEDQWYYFYFLFYVFALIKEPPGVVSIVQAALLSLISFYFKMNSGIVTILVFIACISYLFARKKLDLKIYLGILSLYLLVFGLSNRLLHVDLPGYVIGSLHLIDGHNDAMFLELDGTKKLLITAVLINGILFAWFLYRLVVLIRNRALIKELDEPLIYTVTGLSIFMLFKSAFVRADISHISQFFQGIGLLAGLLYLYSPRKYESKSVAVCCWGILVLSYWALGESGTYYQPLLQLKDFSFISTKIHDVKNYFDGIKKYPDALAASDKLYTQDNALKKIIGNKTVDVISEDISKIYFNGLHYNPRPVIQSYIAYDDYLDNLNYQKYLSPGAPDYILFTLGEQDRRFAFFDEPKTKIAILTRYRIAGEIGDDLLLRKKATNANQSVWERTDTVIARLNEDIPIGEDSDLQYSRLMVKYSGWGKLRRMIYQPPELRITFTLEDDETKTFKAIRPILEEGVPVNKYVVDNDDFRLLMQSDGRRNMRIKKIRLVTDSVQGGFVPVFQMVTAHYRFNQKTAEERIADSLGIVAMTNTYNRYQPLAIDAGLFQPDSFMIGIDNFQKYSQLIRIEGWAFRKNSDNENYILKVVLRSVNNIFELPTENFPRTDLAALFQRKDLAAPGFKALVSKTLLPPGVYQVGILICDKSTQKRWVSYETYQQLDISSDNLPPLHLP